jgi:hypothetical protein
MTSVERQVRTLMGAWPRPDRYQRGDEIVGTTLDLVPDGANRVPYRVAVNLAVGGLRARWRIRPPAWRWVYYRLGGRLPRRWHRWMLNDILSPGWRRRAVLNKVIIMDAVVLLGVVMTAIVSHQTFGSQVLLLALSVLIGSGAAAIQNSRMDRDRRLVRNGYRLPSPKDRAAPPPPATPPPAAATVKRGR